jgi:hypothetical protein
VARSLDGAHDGADTPAVVLSDMPAPPITDVPVHFSGPPVPPQGRIQLYSSDEWEDFIREWVVGLNAGYVQIKRFGGSGDKGADVAAFKSDQGLEGPWDCFQGKHYTNALNFSDATPEMLKVFLAVHRRQYRMPDSYQFLAPKGCGTALNRLLSLPTTLKEKFLGQLVAGRPLVKGIDTAELAAVYKLAEATHFSMFKSVELLDALTVHSRTPYHSARFATTLKTRPACDLPPSDIGEHETRYVEQLLAVYAERHPNRSFSIEALATDDKIGHHFQRQRVSFYKAESLRIYARDSVPPGTFEKLQEDIHSGVIETAEADHPDGFTRLNSVLSQVGQLDLNRHTLITKSDNDDRKGICHQLANADRLTWVEPS